MKKATHQTDRHSISSFQQIMNVGPASEKDFRVLGFSKPQQLIGEDPWRLYCELCKKTQLRHDPCVLDVLIASVDFMNGNPPQVWWSYSEQRKSEYGKRLEDFTF